MQKYTVIYNEFGITCVDSIEVDDDDSIIRACNEKGITRGMIVHILLGEPIFLTNW